MKRKFFGSYAIILSACFALASLSVYSLIHPWYTISTPEFSYSGISTSQRELSTLRVTLSLLSLSGFGFTAAVCGWIIFTRERRYLRLIDLLSFSAAVISLSTPVLAALQNVDNKITRSTTVLLGEILLQYRNTLDLKCHYTPPTTIVDDCKNIQSRITLMTTTLSRGEDPLQELKPSSNALNIEDKELSRLFTELLFKLYYTSAANSFKPSPLPKPQQIANEFIVNSGFACALAFAFGVGAARRLADLINDWYSDERPTLPASVARRTD